VGYGVEGRDESDEGVLRLLTLPPGEVPAQGSLAQSSDGSQAISAEGSSILFVSGGNLYVRIDGERTIQVDQTQGPGPSGGGAFQTASADGSRIFFLDQSKLTAESTAEIGEPDLYECVLPMGSNGCELTDLTVAKPGEHADVLRVSALGSKDGTHVYFTATGVLASNKREYQDSEGKAVVEEAQSGETNLYEGQGGTITFIATLAASDIGAGVVSPDGAWFAFASIRSLTGDENIRRAGTPAQEIFSRSGSRSWGLRRTSRAPPLRERPAVLRLS
jgi:hypothetical protein